MTRRHSQDSQALSTRPEDTWRLRLTYQVISYTRIALHHMARTVKACWAGWAQALSKLREDAAVLKVREADLALLKEVAEPARSKFQQVCGSKSLSATQQVLGGGGGRGALCADAGSGCLTSAEAVGAWT